MLHSQSSHLRTICALLLGLLVCAAISLPAEQAHAKRGGIAIINTGEKLFEVGPFPETAAPKDPKAQVGVKCNQYGLFWAAVWTSDCDLVAYFPEEESFAPLPAEIKAEVAKTYTTSDAKRGLWNRFGIVVFLIIGGLIAVGSLLGGDDDEDE